MADSGNLLTKPETFASGAWQCDSLPTGTHAMYCADAPSTPWSQCEGTCLYIDQVAFSSAAYIAVADTIQDLSAVISHGGEYLFTFDVMVVWLPGSVLPNDAPTDKIQINALIFLATMNQSTWVPLFSKSGSSGYFTTFSWHGTIDSPQPLTGGGQVKISLDHVPMGNGSYGVYLDKISVTIPKAASSGAQSINAVTSLPTGISLGSAQGSSSATVNPAPSASQSTNGSMTILVSPSAFGQSGTLGSAASSPATASNGAPQSGANVGSPIPPSDSSSSNRPLLIGVILGLIGLLLLLLLLGLFIRRRRRRREPFLFPFTEDQDPSLVEMSSQSLHTPPNYALLYDRKADPPPSDAKPAASPTVLTPHPTLSPAHDLDRPPAYDLPGRLAPANASPTTATNRKADL